jgi:hypothetical protein
MCIRRRATAFAKWLLRGERELLKPTVERDKPALVGTALAEKSSLAHLPSNIRKGDQNAIRDDG